jgi:hypothetical protein
MKNKNSELVEEKPSISLRRNKSLYRIFQLSRLDNSINSFLSHLKTSFIKISQKKKRKKTGIYGKVNTVT